MNLYWRKREFADNVRVLDGKRFFDGLALYPFGGQGRAGNRGAAAEGLEAGFLDHLSFRIDAHLQLHNVATFWRADQAGPYVGIFFRKTSDVAGIVVVVYNLFAISHELFSSGASRRSGRKTSVTTNLIAAREIADADEASGAQNFFRNRHVGHPSRTPSGQLTQHVLDVIRSNTKHFQEYTYFLKLLERTLARRLGVITFAIRHECDAECRPGTANGAVYPNCSFTHCGCHCFLSYPSSDLSSLHVVRCVTGLGGLPVHLGNIDTLFSHFVEGRKFAKFVDDRDHLIGHIVNLFFGVETAQSEANRSVG